MDNAVMADPGAANAIFSTAKTGIGALIDSLAKTQTNAWDGALVLQQQSLQSSIQDMTDQETSIQDYLDAEKQRLIEAFTNMESIVSGYQHATSYLNQVANLKQNS